jgi:hypothetical protein
MKVRMLLTIFAIAIVSLYAAACGGSGSSVEGKIIKSTTVDGVTVTLASNSGEVRNGENELMVSFTDASGNPVEISAASLNFHMPAMGSMAEMNDGASLTTTDTQGKFRAKSNIEMAGTWEAQIKYQGPKGSGQTSMTVNVK